MEKPPMDELPFHQDYVQMWQDMNRPVWDKDPGTKYSELSKLIGQYAALNNQFISIFNTKTQSVEYMSPNYLDVLGYTCTEEDYKRWSTLYWMRDLPLAQSWFFVQMTLFFKNTVQPKLKAAQDKKALTWYMHNFLLTPPNGQLHHISLTGKGLELMPDGSMLVMMLIIKDIKMLIKENSPWWAEFTINENDRYVFHQNEKKFQKGSILSKRESEILELVKTGNDTKIIAEKLHISPHTVDKHRKNMIEFTGARDMSSLIQLCEIGKII
ncbi:helix-turn-helix transcriptional regulator [Arundinibacter roseus]|nr:helix-turn-helix transcriptional regulator [Arundinibacter roseus]